MLYNPSRLQTNCNNNEHNLNIFNNHYQVHVLHAYINTLSLSDTFIRVRHHCFRKRLVTHSVPCCKFNQCMPTINWTFRSRVTEIPIKTEFFFSKISMKEWKTRRLIPRKFHKHFLGSSIKKIPINSCKNTQYMYCTGKSFPNTYTVYGNFHRNFTEI